MSQGCGKDRETLAILKEFDKNNKTIYSGWLSKILGKTSEEYTLQVAEELAREGYDAHTFITEKELTVAMIKTFGKKARRKFLAAKIYAVMAANPGIAHLMTTFMASKLPQSVRMEKSKKGEHVTTGKIDLNLERFPERTLNMFLNKALNLINMTNNSGRAAGKLGNFSAWFKTPRALKWLDPTGAFESIAFAVRDHASKVSARINLFMSSPRFIPKEGIDPEIIKRAKIGMETILRKVTALDKTSEYPNEYREQKFHRLFAATMKGWVFINKNGEFMINQDYAPRTEYFTGEVDSEGNEIWIEFINKKEVPEGAKIRVKRYDSTGDVMYSFRNPILLSKYKFKNNKTSFYIDMNKEQFKRFQKYMEQARAMTDLIFEYIVPEMKKSTDGLMDSLIEHYDSKFGETRAFNEYAIRQIFFYNTTEIYDKYNNIDKLEALHPGYTIETKVDSKGIERPYIDLLEKLDDIEIREINIIKETFSATVSDGLVIANHGAFNPDEPEYRKNYWPTIYNVDVFKEMIGKLLNDFKKNYKVIEDRLQNPEISQEEESLLEKTLEKLQDQIDSAQSILNNYDMYHYDSQSGNIMHLASDNKHFKRISNAYDIRSSRLDEGVFYDYLKNMMATVERNNLNAALIETLRRLKADRQLKKPKITEEEADAIRETAVNYHRTTYNSVKVTGLLGDFENYTRRRNYLRYLWPPNWYRKVKDPTYNIAISPEMQARFSRLFTVGLSGLFLQNWKSAVTNFTGAYENVINHGMKLTTDAIKLFIDPEYRKGIRDIIQQSAITEFSDFFSKAMVNGILQMQIEGDIAEQILKEMGKYYKRIGTYYTNEKGRRVKWTKRTSRIKFEEDVVKWLAKSDLWVNAEDLVISKMGRLKAKERELKSRMKLYAANKLVQWAINKQYALRPLIKNKTWGQWFFTPFGSTAVTMSQLYKLVPLTMSNTEAFIRSISFIIGAENAWKNSINGLRNDIHWSEYTEEEDVANIIMIGREYSYLNNFGMSTQDVAQAQFGPAQAFGKFKYWQQQKFEADWNKWDEAIMSIQNQFDKHGNQKREFGFKWGPILKVLYASTKLGGNRENRISSPEFAAIRTTVLFQGMSAFLWNLFLFNPVSLMHFPKFIRSTIETTTALGWRTGIATQLRSFAVTDIMKFIMILPAMAAKYVLQGAFGGDDELEEYDNSLRYFLNSVPFAGYMVTWSYSAIMAYVAFMLGEKDIFARHGESLISIKYGRPQLTPFNFMQEKIRQGGHALFEAMYEAWDDIR